MAAPESGFSLIDVLNNLWIIVAGLVGAMYRIFVKKHDQFDERISKLEVNAATREEVTQTISYLQQQLAKIFDKLEDLKTLIYERTDGETKK